MKFCEFPSSYDLQRRAGWIPKSLTWQQYFATYEGILMPAAQNVGDARIDRVTVASSMNLTLAEHRWYEYGKPYYKLWPAMIDTFMGTRMDVPCEYLQFPFASFTILLPEDPILDFQHDGITYFLRSILVQSGDSICKNNEIIPGRRVVVWMDVGERIDGVIPLLSYRQADFDAGTIEEAFDRLPLDRESMGKGIPVPQCVIEAGIRIAVAISFLATGSHKVLEYDVLSKHLDAYRQQREDSLRRRELEAKAKKYGKFGWHVGRDQKGRHLSLPRGVSYQEAHRLSGGRRELLFQHVRGTHWHIVRFGKRKSKAKVVLYDETVVRPDLPPAPVPLSS